MPPPEPAGRETKPPDRPIDPEVAEAYQDAVANRALTSALGGSGTALLTFALIFLYDRWSSGSTVPFVFEASLLVIITSVFLVSLSSMNFWFVMEALRSRHEAPEKYRFRAEALFGSSWVLLLLEPGLILVSVRLYFLAATAFGFWVVAVLLLVQGFRDARRAPGGLASA